ncbi:ARID DNA-binding domain-containing protein [Tanacetum coccineum]
MSNGSAFTSNRHGKAKTAQPWTTAEEITLCIAWCNVTDNYVTRDAMKRGFWLEVAEERKLMWQEKCRSFSLLTGGSMRMVHGSFCSTPLTPKNWTPDANLLKEDVCTVLVWVKFHHVPITAFNEDGLSAIATKLSTPLMLDSYTSVMYTESWGRSSYARAMTKLRADVEFKDIIMAFGHVLDESPKKIISDVLKSLKNPRQAVRVQVGLRLGFEPTKQVYQHVSKMNGASASGKMQAGSTRQKVDDPINADSDNEMGEVFNETAGFMASTSFKVDNNSKSGSFMGNKIIYEQWKKTYIEDPHDDDDFGLTDAQLKFVNAFDISPHGQLR